jgi:hypothetical protein
MLANLRVLFGRLIDIVLLRGGPESLPASPGILGITILFNVVVTLIVVLLIPTATTFSPLEMIVSILVPLLWFQVAFSLVKKPERFVQTMTAFFGVNALFQPLVAPMFAALVPYLAKQDPNMPPPAALSLLFLAVTVWLLIVWVRIVRAAFEWSTVGAVVFVLAQNFFAIVVYSALFGAAPGKG